MDVFNGMSSVVLASLVSLDFIYGSQHLYADWKENHFLHEI